MKKKNMIYVIIGLIIVLLLSFGGYNLIEAQREKKAQMQEKMTTIQNDYELFASDAKQFNEMKSNFDKAIGSVFYNTLPKQNEEILQVIKDYESKLKSLNEVGERLKENCEETYEKAEINTMCESYKKSFETANNVFQEDILKYKKLIQGYNEWAKDKNEFNTLEEYQG